MATRKKAAKRKPRKAQSDTHKKKRARKPGAGTGRGHVFKPSDEQRLQVKVLLGLGLTYREISSVVVNPKTSKGISVNTLQKHFGDELEEGSAFVKSRVGQSLLRKALSDNHPSAAASAMFIMKCRFGWRQEDKIVHEVEGGTGVLIAPADLTPAEWIKKSQERNKDKKCPTDD